MSVRQRNLRNCFSFAPAASKCDRVVSNMGEKVGAAPARGQSFVPAEMVHRAAQWDEAAPSLCFK